MNAFEELVDDALALLWETNPVGASFAGETSYDARLPDAGTGAISREARRLAELGERSTATVVPDASGARLDARFVRTLVDQGRAELAARPRFHNPAWYTGEAAFGLIALLLRPDEMRDDPALAARLDALPDFLAAGTAQLAGRPLPRAWVDRARSETFALARLLSAEPPSHPRLAALAGRRVAAALAATERFRAALDGHADASAACGAEYLTALMHRVHGFTETAAELEGRAATAFATALAALEESAARRDPARSWRQQLADLARIAPDPGDALATYRAWHERALAAARDLVSPPGDYALTFAALPPWAQAVASDLYFLWYRSPAARRPGSGSTYWVDGPASVATIKLVHAVHHGSIGHHTQNYYARAAASRFARIAGTDAASGLVLLSAGTLVEGWACYAEELMTEIPDFYTAAERLQLDYFALRNIACALADVRLHAGVWSLAEMQRFYRDDVAFAPGRIVAETTRNSIFPGSRLMYRLGTERIAALRARSTLPARAFHDRLLAFGSAPVAWIAEELAA